MRSFVIAVALAFLACNCPARTIIYRPRFVPEQQTNTVLIERWCMIGDLWDGSAYFGADLGSGVVIDSAHVLTAYHLVNCQGTQILKVVTKDGSHYNGVLDKFERDSDIATVSIIGLKLDLDTRPVIGPVPNDGDKICSAVAFPAFESKCGETIAVVTRASGDIAATFISVMGNSGGGVYDESGRLIGVVVAMIPCKNDANDPEKNPDKKTNPDSCGGFATWIGGQRGKDLGLID